MIVIQRITTFWTKKSRGGKGAIARNAVPEALTLPSFAASAELVVHKVVFDESNAFRRKAEIQKLTMANDWELNPVRLRLLGDQIQVRCMFGGAPERWPRQAFVLSYGQWGRLAYNRRFADSYDGSWRYEKEVFNVAFADQVRRRQFFDTEPDKTASFLDRLR